MDCIYAKLEELQQETSYSNAGQDYEDLADEIDSLREKKQEVWRICRREDKKKNYRNATVLATTKQIEETMKP